MFEMKKKSLTVHENNDTWPNVTQVKHISSSFDHANCKFFPNQKI